MFSRIESLLLGLYQFPGQVLHHCYEITFLHLRQEQHSCYFGVRELIHILLTLQRYLLTGAIFDRFGRRCINFGRMELVRRK